MSILSQIAAGAGLLIAVAWLVLVAPRLWWLVFGFMIWASSFSSAGAVYKGVRDGVYIEQRLSLAFPLDILTHNGRPICGICLVALVLQGVNSQRGWRKRRVVGALIFLSVLELYYAFRMLLGGLDPHGALAILTFVLMAVYFSIVLPNRLQSMADFRAPLYALLFAGILFASGVFYQSLMDSRYVYYQGRFEGTTSNPNHGAHFLAILIPPVLWLALNVNFKTIFRVGLFCLVGLFVIWLIRSGSRGGALTAIAGVAFGLRRRVRHVFLYGCVAVVIFIGIMQLLPGGAFAESRLLSTLDNRTAGWMAALRGWEDDPIWGYVNGASTFTENSYVAALCGLGIFGGALIGGFVVSSLLNLWSLSCETSKTPQLIAPSDMVTGGLMGLFTCGMFEAFLLGIYTPFVYTLFTYLAELAFLRDLVARRNNSGGVNQRALVPIPDASRSKQHVASSAAGQFP